MVTNFYARANKTMQIETLIKQQLEQNLTIQKMALINESHKHAGHAGDDGSGQTHFKLIVVSSDFEGCTRIERQRMVYDHLKQAFDSGLHALSLKLFTPDEYVQKGNSL
jgi:BolA protein